MQTLGGSLFLDPSQNPQYPRDPAAQAFAAQSLTGSMMNDPRSNPAYMASLQPHNSAPPTSASHGWVVPAAGQNAGEQNPNAPPPAPTLQPPQVNWGLINQLLGGGGSGAGSSAVPQYNSNITAGPVWNPQQTSAATSAIAGGGGGAPASVPGVPMSGNQTASINSQAADAGHAATSLQAVQFARQAAEANAQQQLASQQARASQGVSLANFLGQMQQNNFTQQDRQRSMLELLMGQLGPLAGFGG